MLSITLKDKYFRDARVEITNEMYFGKFTGEHHLGVLPTIADIGVGIVNASKLSEVDFGCPCVYWKRDMNSNEYAILKLAFGAWTEASPFTLCHKSPALM